jgi:predicted O-linked N-acetylglucosamine transferase (SPINDLY family)
MGFLDIVASSKEQYIAKAVKLGSNREYNNHCSSIISRNKHKLFEEEKSFLDWKKMIASFLK